MKKLFVLLLSLFTFTVFSHEGHNETPGSIKSLHGGIVQQGKQINLEVIVNGNAIQIFPTSHEGKDIPLKDVKITAKAKPKKGKAYDVNFNAGKDSYATTVDLQGANRLPVEVTVTTNGKNDYFTIQVEE